MRGVDRACARHAPFFLFICVPVRMGLFSSALALIVAAMQKQRRTTQAQRGISCAVRGANRCSVCGRRKHQKMNFGLLLGGGMIITLSAIDGGGAASAAATPLFVSMFV